MKCPNCGAETQERVCEFCGSEMPKEKETVNITNNYYGETPLQEKNADATAGTCPKCGSTKISFKRERVAVSTKSSSRSKALGTGRNGSAYSQSSYRTIGLCQNCGFTWNPNASVQGNEKKGAPIWLWVIGWICIFPLPLTILLLRKKEMKPVLKYGIIAVAWLIYLLIAFSGKSDDTNKSTQATTTEETQAIVETTEKVSTVSETDTTVPESSSEANSEDPLAEYIDSLVNDYNATAEEKLVYVEDFIPSDKSSGHYRTEFRLGAYKDAIGKSYLLGDKVVDIIANGFYGNVNSRIYTNDVSFEQIESLVKGMSPLMDPELSAAEFNDAFDRIEEEKTANGLYFGNLGMTLFGSDTKGYEMMLKLGN